jgi:hypothetical protein
MNIISKLPFIWGGVGYLGYFSTANHGCNPVFLSSLDGRSVSDHAVKVVQAKAKKKMSSRRMQ